MSEAMILLSSFKVSANRQSSRKFLPRKNEQKPLLVAAGRRRCGVIVESEKFSTAVQLDIGTRPYCSRSEN